MKVPENLLIPVMLLDRTYPSTTSETFVTGVVEGPSRGTPPSPYYSMAGVGDPTPKGLLQVICGKRC